MTIAEWAIGKSLPPFLVVVTTSYFLLSVYLWLQSSISASIFRSGLKSSLDTELHLSSQVLIMSNVSGLNGLLKLMK
jgi:hypothetical protein